MAAEKSQDFLKDDGDHPPPYSTASNINAPYILPEEVQTEVQLTVVNGERSDQKYSCSNSVVEFAERITRIFFIMILITFTGLTIAAMVRINIRNDNSASVYQSDVYEDTGFSAAPFIFIVLLLSLVCTIGTLLCDVTVIIAQFISTKVINHVIFRSLDIIKWILLAIGFAIDFILVQLFTTESVYTGPIVTAYLVFCAITIAMGIIITIWDCGHMIISASQTRSPQVVRLAPATNSI